MNNITEIQDASQSKTALWALAREGARVMIQAALIQEQQDFLDQNDHLLTEAGLNHSEVLSAMLGDNVSLSPASVVP